MKKTGIAFFAFVSVLAVSFYAFAQDSTQAVLDGAKALLAAEATHNTTGIHVAVAAILALVFKWLLDAAMRITDPTDEAKKLLPWICAVLGLVVGIITKYGNGSSWVDSIIVGGAGPGAVLANEIGNSIKGLISKKPVTTSSVPSVSPAIAPVNTASTTNKNEEKK